MYHDFLSSWNLLDELPLLEPQPGFNAAVWHKIEALPRKRWEWLVPASSFSPVWRVAVAAAVLVMVSGVGYLGFIQQTDDSLIFTPNDLEDNRLLNELNQLINTDESQFLNIYQPWELNQEVPDAENPPPDTDPADPLESEEDVEKAERASAILVDRARASCC